MGSTGATGLLKGRPGSVKHLPITGEGGIDSWEARMKGEAAKMPGQGKVEYGILFDSNGQAIDGYLGNEHSVLTDKKVWGKEGEGVKDGIFTHFHPDNDFGGTLSMQDLAVYADSDLKEIRAFSQQGQLYSVKAGPNADKKKLASWVKKNKKLQQKNFEKSYESALKAATTPLKSGPHKGQVKLVNRNTGKTVYRDPMTDKQAQAYARAYSVGSYDRMYKKNLEKYGFTYTATKAGKKNQ